MCKDPAVTGVDQESATCLLQRWASRGDLGSKAQRGSQARAGKNVGLLEGHSGILDSKGTTARFQGTGGLSGASQCFSSLTHGLYHFLPPLVSPHLLLALFPSPLTLPSG